MSGSLICVASSTIWLCGSPNESRPGCLLLNMLAERGSGDDGLVARAEQYRARLRALFTIILERDNVAQPQHQAELSLAAVLGMNVAARSGADRPRSMLSPVD